MASRCEQSAVKRSLINALRRWLVSHTGEELNVVSEDPTDLSIETIARPGSGAVLVVRRYAPLQAANDIAYRSMSPAPLIELALAYRDDNPSPILANLLKVVDELVPTYSSSAPLDGELV